MSSVFTLESMREEIEREYAPVPIDTGDGQVKLQSVMRVGKIARQEVIEKLKTLESETDEDELEEDATIEAVRYVIRRVAETDAGAEKLIAALGDDLMLHMKITEKWQEATQPGEAQDSPS